MSNTSLTLSANDKLMFVSNMVTMITAGIPILEVLDSLLEEAKGNTKLLLEVIREDLVQGNHLYVSLMRFPRVFDKATVNVLRASEEAGTLAMTLKDIKEEIMKDTEFNDRIKSALMYPALISIVFLGVLMVILLVVMPKIATVFLRLNVTLPFATRMLIAASQFILAYSVPVCIVLGAMVIGFIIIARTKTQWVLRMVYSLPIISGFVKEIDLTRFARSMHLLLTSGITITYALELARDVVMRSDVAYAIDYAREMVLAGKDLTDAFKERKLIFPIILIKILEAGEKTGTLEKSMQDISEYLDYQVSKKLKTFTTLLEPIMLVLVGLLVGGMMLAIIAPIYGLIGQVSTR